MTTNNSILRIRYSKLGKVRYTSHRDTARIWERTLRKVGMPVAYSEGFSPRPKLGFGLALPTGYESAGEYLDITVAAPDELDGALVGVGLADGRHFDIESLPQLLSQALPDGIDVQAVEVLENRGESLQEQIVMCGWEFEISDLEPEDVDRLMSQLRLLKSSVTRSQEQKTRDTHS